MNYEGLLEEMYKENVKSKERGTWPELKGLPTHKYKLTLPICSN